MSTLLLKLAAPLQAWGAESRFPRRTTRPEPTKSAVLGMVASAQGRRRADSIEDLLGMYFGVRVDQPGVLVRDFQTAHRGKDSMPLSERYYLSDAVFIVGLEADISLLLGIRDALLCPAFPLFLGRRSCVPSGKLVIGIEDAGLVDALRAHPWEASPWYKRRTASEPQLELLRDVLPSDVGTENRETIQDEPLSFSQVRRDWGWREVVHDDPVTITGGKHAIVHDPMSALEAV